MGDKQLPVNMPDKRKDIQFISDTFGLKNTVEHLHYMMKEVTKDEFSARTVNAACNCVQQLNSTIDMAIKAARYLSEK
jgi:hypothetical protein